MKTIHGWFKTIEDEQIQEAAIMNTSVNNLKRKEDSLHIAITSAFVWEFTSRGHDFWEKLRNKLVLGGTI